MIDCGEYYWTLLIGIPPLVASFFLFRRFLRTSSVWRFIFCALLAATAIPVGVLTAESSAHVFSVPSLLLGGRKWQTLLAIRAVALFVLPGALLSFGIWSFLLRLCHKRS